MQASGDFTRMGGKYPQKQVKCEQIGPLYLDEIGQPPQTRNRGCERNAIR